MSIFSKNIRVFFKIVPFLKARVWDLCLTFFSYIFSFFKIKGCFYRLSIQNPVSTLLEIDGKITTTPKFIDMTLWSISLTFSFASLLKFSYCSKFHINIIAGSGVVTVFFHMELTRNPEIRNTLVWVSPNI